MDTHIYEVLPVVNGPQKMMLKCQEDIVVKMGELIIKKDMEYKETMRKTFWKK